MVSEAAVLIGFMGSGKSTLSRALHKHTGYLCLSTDDLVETQAGVTISEIFQKHGEQEFRKLESEVIAGLSNKDFKILDCGGGVILEANNREKLKSLGTVIYLKASPEFLYEQIKTQKHRPLMQVADPLVAIKTLLQEREVFYQETAHHVVSSECDSVEPLVEAVLLILGWKNCIS